MEMQTPCVTYAHFPHDDCPGVESTKTYENTIMLEFYHEVNDVYGAEVGEGGVVSIIETDDGFTVNLDDDSTFDVEWACIRAYDTD